MLTVKGLNSRIRRIKDTFGKDALYTNLMHDLKNIEGLEITESGFISAKVKDKMSLAAAEANVYTVTDILKDVQQAEFGDEKATKSELIAMANYREILTGAYEGALASFYNAKPGNMNSVAFQEFSDLQAALQHPGIKLTEEEIEQNKQKIEEFIDKLNKGDFNDENS